jgi:hypothetical protein
MSNGEQSYNLSQIRKLLNLFDDLELSAWCLDHFPTVYEKFSSGMRKDKKINLLLTYCRRGPNRFEQLLAIVQAEDEEAFKQFEPSLIGEGSQPLLALGMERATLRRLLSELSEWKVIHNDVQDLLDEMEKPFNYFTSYNFKRDTDWLEQGIFAWDKLQASKLSQIPDQWDFQYADSSSLGELPQKAKVIDEVAEQLMNEVTEVNFKFLYRQFNQFRGVLWQLLQTADQKIKILIEDILTLIGE